MKGVVAFFRRPSYIRLGFTRKVGLVRNKMGESLLGCQMKITLKDIFLLKTPMKNSTKCDRTSCFI